MAETEISGANQLVLNELKNRLLRIEDVMQADCLSYIGPIAFGADDFIRDAIEDITDKKKKLLFILETEGGFAEAARRISDTIRHHYEEVVFLIPSHAMSAGTILAMSGDDILMDYYSVLGPIDPQVSSQDGRRLIPALGYLEKYNELLKSANAGNAGAAELQILLNFDQGELYAYEQARNLSVSLLEEWLAKFKFKNWERTETRGEKVTPEMRKKRAKEIAEKLNDINLWNSHGIGIGMELLRKELNLKIDDFGNMNNLNTIVRSYHRLLSDFMIKMGDQRAVHTRMGYEQLVRGTK
jgi:hypothetical protein